MSKVAWIFELKVNWKWIDSSSNEWWIEWFTFFQNEWWIECIHCFSEWIANVNAFTKIDKWTLNWFKYRVTPLCQIWITLISLWIKFESFRITYQLRITLNNFKHFKPTVHRVISLKTLKQKLFTCSTPFKITIRNTFCNFLIKVWRTATATAT